MTLTLHGHSGLVEEKNHRGIISTSKQAISIKHAAKVGHDTFYFSPKSSVAIFLSCGHTSFSDILCMQFGQAVPAFGARFRLRNERRNFIIVLARHLDMTSNQTLFTFH